jgi:hypothetical protein
MSYPIGLQVLKAKIRGFQATGATISSRISKSEKERKNRLWNEKRRLGLHCRYHLVAYGLLRGVRYDQIERCAPNNKLNPQAVLDIMLAHHSPSLSDWIHWRDLNLEKVKLLLTPAIVVAPPVPAREPSLKATESSQRTQSHEQTPPSTSTKPEGLLARARRLLEKRA